MMPIPSLLESNKITTTNNSINNSIIKMNKNKNNKRIKNKKELKKQISSSSSPFPFSPSSSLSVNCYSLNNNYQIENINPSRSFDISSSRYSTSTSSTSIMTTTTTTNTTSITSNNDNNTNNNIYLTPQCCKTGINYSGGKLFDWGISQETSPSLLQSFIIHASLVPNSLTSSVINSETNINIKPNIDINSVIESTPLSPQNNKVKKNRFRRIRCNSPLIESERDHLPAIKKVKVKSCLLASDSILYESISLFSQYNLTKSIRKLNENSLSGRDESQIQSIFSDNNNSSPFYDIIHEIDSTPISEHSNNIPQEYYQTFPDLFRLPPSSLSLSSSLSSSSSLLSSELESPSNSLSSSTSLLSLSTSPSTESTVSTPSNSLFSSVCHNSYISKEFFL